MMKRRHRLAEVLLNRIPFDGNIHETACRLEHAIDDDLEVALTVLLGDPQYDPSGRNIPRSGLHLEKRIQTVQQSHARLSELKSNESGCIKVFFYLMNFDHFSENRFCWVRSLHQMVMEFMP